MTTQHGKNGRKQKRRKEKLVKVKKTTCSWKRKRKHPNNQY
jgi:hypothetical protein